MSGLEDVTIVGLAGTLDKRGGAERAFRSIAEGFETRLGMRVLLAAHLPPDDPEVRDRATVLRRAGEPAGPAMLRRMRALIASAPAPAILFPFQINSNIVASVANASLPRARRLPTVLNDRAAITEITSPRPGSGARGRVEAAAVRVVARAVYRRADVVVCNARANAEQVRRFVGRPTPPIETVYNPLDARGIQARHPERDHAGGLGDRGPLVVAHGRLDPQKGFDTLIRAFAGVRGRAPGARLRIVGEGGEREVLQRLAASLGVAEGLELPGHRDDPLAAIADGDVYVLPSRWEGLPNALLEALALGLPAIAADCPTGPAEILDPPGEAGLLVPVDDVPALERALATLLGDPARRAALAGAARRRALDFAPEVATDAYAAIFRRLLGRDPA